MSRPSLTLALASLLTCTTLLAAPPTSHSPALRSIQQLDTNWRFSQSDPAEAQSPTFDDTAWATVTLPHDWSIDASIAGPVAPTNPSGSGDGYFPTGIAWYRHTLALPTLDPNQRTYIAFDGVMANSDVYCNGQLLGHRPYGYISFHYDLTPCLHPGPNILAVRSDTSQQPASRWYPGAGINRHVRLITTSATHIAPWGTFVTTPTVTAASATIHVRTTATNQSPTPANVTLAVTLISPTGQPLQTFTSPVATLAPNATADLDAQTTLPTPDRWDLNHPALYSVHATLVQDKKPIDEETVPFGIREFHFDPNLGFFLNGTHHKIFGVALHTDAGALGTAVPLAAWQLRLTALRALGVNAIRTAHNPPAPEFLDLCDHMGFLVMDEMFDAWTVAKNPYDYHLYFRQWSLIDTADTVQRDRNHPSIILYSAGNEIHDTPHPEIAIPILKSLVETFHHNDPTRPVTQALFRPNVSRDYDNGLADLLDVVGQNYREQEILKAHADKPSRSIVGTENTHDRNQWIAMRDHPEYSGQFLWSGMDYLGEAGRWPSIGAGSGLLLTTALPRARAFERQSWWSTPPMVRIARRVQAAQQGPIDPGYASPTSTNQQAAPAGDKPAALPPDPTTRFGQPLLIDWTPANLQPHTENIEIYTNAQQVELLLNGQSLGTQKLHPDASPITFQVPFTPGTLQAIARTNGKIVATDTLRTAGKPTHLVLTTNTTTLTPNWDDLAYVTATLVDANGTTLPDSTTLIHFTTTGPATILAVDNGNLLDHDPFHAAQRHLYQGNAIAILRTTAPAGTIQITATTEGLPPTTLTLKSAPIPTQSNPRSF